MRCCYRATKHDMFASRFTRFSLCFVFNHDRNCSPNLNQVSLLLTTEMMTQSLNPKHNVPRNHDLSLILAAPFGRHMMAKDDVAADRAVRSENTSMCRSGGQLQIMHFVICLSRKVTRNKML